jgi:hypothetical protein
MASADEKGWQLDSDGRVYGLHVILLKQEYVLPWSQFLYAEGTSEELRVVFSTHDVIVRGAELSSLLAHLASQQVTVIREPARADKFTAASGPRLSGLEVRRVDA